jgi:hypothetical protein
MHKMALIQNTAHEMADFMVGSPVGLHRFRVKPRQAARLCQIKRADGTFLSGSALSNWRDALCLPVLHGSFSGARAA